MILNLFFVIMIIYEVMKAVNFGGLYSQKKKKNVGGLTETKH